MDKENIRATLSRATQHRPAAEIARDLGLPPAHLYNFLSRGAIGRDKLALIETWLINHGYAPESHLTPAELIAADLEHLAALLRSDAYTPHHKATILYNRITALHQALDSHTRALLK